MKLIIKFFLGFCVGVVWGMVLLGTIILVYMLFGASAWLMESFFPNAEGLALFLPAIFFVLGILGGVLFLMKGIYEKTNR